MSAPSVLHDHRVDVLGDLADLAGYTVAVDLYDGLRPDLCRLHHSARALLIGDAKATEHPGDAATRARLNRYVHGAANWLSLGFNVSIVICHGPDLSGLWHQCIESVVTAAGHRVGLPQASALDPETAVTAVPVKN